MAALRAVTKRYGRTSRTFSGHLGADQVGVGFLDEIIHVRQTGKTSAEIGPQRGFMRLHLDSEPLRMVGDDGLFEACGEGCHWDRMTPAFNLRAGGSRPKKRQGEQFSIRELGQFVRDSTVAGNRGTQPPTNSPNVYLEVTAFR